MNVMEKQRAAKHNPARPSRMAREPPIARRGAPVATLPDRVQNMAQPDVSGRYVAGRNLSRRRRRAPPQTPSHYKPATCRSCGNRQTNIHAD